ncbi:LysR family transcriptional regulator [Klebsiella quasipneumoniae]|uniref:LysR family transcriptional regulator n=1 Tax=Klebsiella quasipneumoniae TaxID=1463165 RepID=UPI00217D04C9|nr:LysR family transcriptional regulator [Klebsiella quasipneumoniae]MCS6746667.1 LysR family transcriptional regulator [Klebsiella quasipneumoniae]
MESKGGNRSFDYNLIKVLDAVISAGNAVKAAKKLAITPAAVSLALRRLQSFYQHELFVRSKDGLLPTAKAVEIHQNFRQAIALVNGTFMAEKKSDDSRITILGSEFFESYYLTQIYGHSRFEQGLINHFSVRNITVEKVKELLLTAQCDLSVGTEPLAEAGLESQMIDNFRNFICICARDHIFAELQQLSLHQFYSSRHAIFQPGMNTSPIIAGNGLFKDDVYYNGSRLMGYRSDSITGLVSMVERTALIAVMPLKLALFYKNQRKYDIKFVQPPPELTFKSVQVYASWSKSNTNLSTVNETVAMLQTLSSFRR